MLIVEVEWPWRGVLLHAPKVSPSEETVGKRMSTTSTFVDKSDPVSDQIKRVSCADGFQAQAAKVCHEYADALVDQLVHTSTCWKLVGATCKGASSGTHG